MAKLNFPAQIKCKDVDATVSCDYHPEDYEVHEDLFHGITKKNAAKYLIRREIEQSHMKNEYNERIRRSSYTNYFASIIKNYAETTISDPPYLEGSEKMNYLNDDLVNLVHALLVDSILHGHCWLRVNFNEMDEEQKIIIPTFEEIDPVCIDDWQDDNYVRYRYETSVRPDPFTAPNALLKQLTYVTPEEVVLYELLIEDGKKPPEYYVRRSIVHHDLGKIPYFKLEMPHGLEMGNLLKDLAISIFNHESDLSWSLCKQAFSVLCLFTDLKNLKDIVAAETNAIVLNKGDDAKFVSPDTGNPKNLEERIKCLREEMYRTANQSAYTAVASNGNASGKSKRMDYTTLITVLTFLAENTRMVLQDGCVMIAEILGCPVPSVEGMVDFKIGDENAENEKTEQSTEKESEGKENEDE